VEGRDQARDRLAHHGLNHLVIEPAELGLDGTVRLSGRRLIHAREVLRVKPGATVKVGLLGGMRGRGEVLSVGEDQVVLEVKLDEHPPPRAGIDLVLGMPRPKQLKRVLAAAASLGVGRIVLLNAAKVEKSYFDSKVLDPAYLASLLRLGLEQARDTVPPKLFVRELFRPFVEDELDAFCGGARRLLAHGEATEPLARRAPGEHVVLAVGPEGGWTPFELELITAQKFLPVTLGPRPLRVEVVVPALVGALGPG
jgi:RsmE family RNA methyltransferase